MLSYFHKRRDAPQCAVRTAVPGGLWSAADRELSRASSITLFPLNCLDHITVLLR